MSRDIAEYLIKHQDKLDRTIIDYASIGLLLSTYFTPLDI